MENNVETNKTSKKNKIIYAIVFVISVVACYFVGYFIGYDYADSKAKESEQDNEIVEDENQEQNDEIVEEEKSEEDYDEEYDEEVDVEVEYEELEPVKLGEAYTPKCNNEHIEKGLFSDIKDNEYSNIFDYIKKQENISISYSYCDEDEDGDGVFNLIKYDLTQSEMSKLLDELGKLKGVIFDDGVGGVCPPTINIRYKKGEYDGYVSLWGDILATNDGNIYRIIDDNYKKKFDKEYCVYVIEDTFVAIGNTLDIG